MRPANLNNKKGITAACFSDGLLKVPYWRQLLGVGKATVIRFGAAIRQDCQLLVDWGNVSQEKALALQKKTGLPLLRIEDGFIRSLGLGVLGSTTYSLVFDDIGIYYDASGESRLERLLNGKALETTGLTALDVASVALDNECFLGRARRCMAQIRRHGISKYNNLPEGELGSKTGKRVLLVDQTLGDLSVSGGLASEEHFRQMLDDALALPGEIEILIKTHPDVVAGKKQGYLREAVFDAVSQDKRLRLVDEAINPYSLLEQVDEVWVVASQMGFEALIADKPVRCYGMPFYAGWGLTDDRQVLPRRARRRTLEQVFAAAYFSYSKYFDPDTGTPCELEGLLDFIARQRSMYKANAGQLLCCGFPPWRRAYLRAYLQSPWNTIAFENNPAALMARATSRHRVLIWGSTVAEQQRNQLAAKGVEVWRVEDAFIRSVGLGKYYVPPQSLIIDKTGIYYDPSGPSDLENILHNTVFSALELQRSRRLIDHLVEQKLSKYNVGANGLPALETKPEQRVILVPGQVESDASIAAGCVDVCTDRELLQAVRDSRPQAFIVYKPHPDVVSGNESGDFSGNRELADLTVTEASIDDCIAVADEVHTLTSLAGFEALLRGKKVVVYGLPFYAGWGLTWDCHPIDRRKRQLSLEQLVAGVLIRYPRYLNLQKRHFTTPEFAIQTLLHQRDNQPRQEINTMRWQRLMRKGLNLARSLYYGWRSS